MYPEPFICVSRTGLRPPRDSPMLGVVKSIAFTSNTPCLLPEDCRPPSVRAHCPQKKMLSQKTLSKRSKKLSKAEISKIKRERLPWTPEPLLPKIYGFDVFGIETTDPLPKYVFYGVPDEYIDRKWGEAKLRKYKNNTIILQKMADARVFTKCHKPRNPDKIPISYRETAEQYVHQVYNGVVLKDEAEHKFQKMGAIPRIRHPVDTCSYPNNSVNEDEMSSLHRYVWKGKYNKLTKRLHRLKDYREINVQDDVGRTPLHIAASWQCSKILKPLLKCPGILINLADKDGKTPLHKAVEAKDLDCVKLLVQRGAIVRKPALDNRNPFEYALQEYGDEAFDILKYLYHEGGINSERKYEGQLTFLHLACLVRRRVSTVQIMSEMIASGEVVNATEGLGRTALILATQMAKVDLVKLLLQCCADILHIDMNMKAAIQYSKPGSQIHHLLRDAINRHKQNESEVSHGY